MGNLISEYFHVISMLKMRLIEGDIFVKFDAYSTIINVPTLANTY